MDEKPKSIWKKSWKGPRGFMLAFLLLAFSVFVIVACFEEVLNGLSGFRDIFKFALYDLLISTCIAIIGVLIAWFIRWLFCWRNFKRFLFSLACFATLIALFYAEEDWRGKHDWEKFKREWEAKGEKFDWQSIVPPAVPDDQNFALTPIVFTSYGSMLTRDGKMIPYKDRHTNFVDRLKMEIVDNYEESPKDGNWQTAKITDLKTWRNYYRALAATTNEFSIAPQPRTPAQDVLLALGKYSSAIEELREASKLPYSRFPLEYDKDDPAEILLPHLADLKRCSQVLQLRAIAELQNGESDKAVADVKLSFRLTDSVRTEPILISHLVRAAILNLTLQPIYEGLAEHKWSDAQLAELDLELAKLDFLADYKLSMRGERAFDIGIIEFLRHAHNKFREFANMTGDSPGGFEIDWPTMALSFGPSGWYDQNELNCARPLVEFYLPAADVKQQTISPAKIRAADRAIDAETKHLTPNNTIERMLLPALGASAKKFSYTQTSVNLARVAVALERFRLAHGNYPDSLDAIAAQFPNGIPHDIINGQPLHYRRTDDGQFVLYSVGWNETDDGGVVVLKKGKTPDVDRDEGDWVWRYPSK